MSSKCTKRINLKQIKERGLPSFKCRFCGVTIIGKPDRYNRGFCNFDLKRCQKGYLKEFYYD